MKQAFTSHSPKETMEMAQKLAQANENCRFWCLEGTLGSGKTVFSKGLGKAFGFQEKEMKSPTYTYVREHKSKKLRLLHFDFYRTEFIDDLMAHDVEEMFNSKNTRIIIEWPDRVKHLIQSEYMLIRFQYINENERFIEAISIEKTECSEES